MNIEMELNGRPITVQAAPGAMLAEVLRQAGALSVKTGCNEGTCGACTVLLDGRPVASCITFAAQAHGRQVTTVEALGTPTSPHPIQKAFVEAGAVQCGFCTPGMILSTKALLDRHPSPTPEQICEALDGNLCRCTGYVKIIDAVQAAAARLRDASPQEDRR
jgi:carbon-monoxide dehydrogenase small subunit